MGIKECELKGKRGLEQWKEKPLRQRAERKELSRQSRTPLSQSITKRRDASWEPEPCDATDAMLDERTMAHIYKSKKQKVECLIELFQ